MADGAPFGFGICPGADRCTRSAQIRWGCGAYRGRYGRALVHQARVGRAQECAWYRVLHLPRKGVNRGVWPMRTGPTAADLVHRTTAGSGVNPPFPSGIGSKIAGYAVNARIVPHRACSPYRAAKPLRLHGEYQTPSAGCIVSRRPQTFGIFGCPDIVHRRAQPAAGSLPRPSVQRRQVRLHGMACATANIRTAPDRQGIRA